MNGIRFFLFVLLALTLVASPAYAGATTFNVYRDKASFLQAATGMFVDIYFEYYSATAVAVGSYVNSQIYPPAFGPTVVPLEGVGVALDDDGPMEFIQGTVQATTTYTYIGLEFADYGTMPYAAGIYVSTPVGYGPTLGELAVLYYTASGNLLGFDVIQGTTTEEFFGLTSNNGPINSLSGRLTSYNGNIPAFYAPLAALSHVVLEAQYLSTGGDPHIKSSVIDAILPGLAANDHVNLFAHPKASVNARLRSFDFLDFEHATYYGAVGVRLANGDRVVVEALEADDGTPDFKVTVNGAPMAKQSALSVEAGDASYEVHYDAHGNVPHGRDVSVFHRDYPYMTHEALVRVHMPGVVAIDIDLASKDAFVDWHQPKPVVYRQAGAFLNVAVRDLVQESRSEAAGLLKVTDRMQRAKLAIEAKAAEQLAAGDDASHARATEAKNRIDNMLADIVAEHRVDSLFD